MVLLSKPLTEEETNKAYRRIQQLGMLGVFNQNFCLMAETELITNCVGGDPGKAAGAMALTSALSGVAEFFLNPLLGKLADKYGRKFLVYIGPILSGIFMNLAVLATGGKNLNVAIMFRAVNWSMMSISNSFVGPICISDMFSGQELGIRVAKFFGSFGIPVILAPALGNLATRISGSPLLAFKLRLCTILYHLFHVHFFIPETLTKERQREFTLSGGNPLAFLKLFSWNSTKTIRTLVAFQFFSMMAEGKNLIAVYLPWMNNAPLYWSPFTKTCATTLYGVEMIGSGMFGAPKLIPALGARGFTTLANVMNFVAFTIWGMPLPTLDVSLWLAMMFHSVGINNTNASAVKSITIDHAVAKGYGRGEVGGMMSSLRSMSLTVAPFMYKWAYRPSSDPKSKAPPGFPFLMAAIFAAALPELLHRSLSDEDLKVPAADTSKSSS